SARSGKTRRRDKTPAESRARMTGRPLSRSRLRCSTGNPPVRSPTWSAGRRIAPLDFRSLRAKLNWERAPDTTSPGRNARRVPPPRSPPATESERGLPSAAGALSLFLHRTQEHLHLVAQPWVHPQVVVAFERKVQAAIQLDSAAPLCKNHRAVRQKCGFRYRVRHEDHRDPAGPPQFAQLRIQAKARDLI